ncbi:MAG TPA: type I 3-dehydroquinate dehydratase [Chthoniobacterales bacterium]
MRSCDTCNHWRPRLVGVIASSAALVRATRLRRPPDFFELRLDALHDSLGELEQAIPRLRAPLILSARHPAEGGQGSLGAARRRELFERFLDHAALIDLELRSVSRFSTLLHKMHRGEVDLLLSIHQLCEAPLPELFRLTNSAAAYKPSIFKIAVRTDTPEQVDRLINFFCEARSFSFPIAAMGIGKLGRQARRQLLHLGSALAYGSIGDPIAEGQPTLTQLRRDRRAYI